MSDVDPIAAVMQLLLDDTDVAALVSTRVYGAEIPEKDTQNMPQACVVIAPAGGLGAIGSAFQDYGDTRVAVFCHGSTLLQSWQVYLAVYAAFKRVSRVKKKQVLLHWIRPSAKGATGRDPDTQWPTTLASFQVLASETAAL